MLVNSGSLFTIISKDVFERDLKGKMSALLQPDIRAVGYGGKRINILGMDWKDIFQGKWGTW